MMVSCPLCETRCLVFWAGARELTINQCSASSTAATPRRTAARHRSRGPYDLLFVAKHNLADEFESLDPAHPVVVRSEGIHLEFQSVGEDIHPQLLIPKTEMSYGSAVAQI